MLLFNERNFLLSEYYIDIDQINPTYCYRKSRLYFIPRRSIIVRRATGDATNPAKLGIGPEQLLQLGKERTDAMLNLHKELLDAYQEASQAWVGRVQLEVQFWSELAGKLAANRSVPEGLETYRDSISHRLEMAAEDGRRTFEDGQKMVAAVTASLFNGSAKAK